MERWGGMNKDTTGYALPLWGENLAGIQGPWCIEVDKGTHSVIDLFCWRTFRGMLKSMPRASFFLSFRIWPWDEWGKWGTCSHQHTYSRLNSLKCKTADAFVLTRGASLTCAPANEISHMVSLIIKFPSPSSHHNLIFVLPFFCLCLFLCCLPWLGYRVALASESDLVGSRHGNRGHSRNI